MNIIIILAIIIAVPFIIALFLSNDYIIEKEIIIKRSKLEVFDYIKHLKNQDYYSKWVMTDPAARKEYKGIDGTTGFIYAWDSDNKQVGKGEQEIKRIIDGEGIDIEVRFIRPFQGKAHSMLKAESLPDGQTRAVWIFSGERNYGMKIMHLLMNLKKVLGKDLETSLITLKMVLEKDRTSFNLILL